MKDGIYCLVFGGCGGTGMGMLVCTAGTITGADNFGSRIDGSYKPQGAGGTEAQLSVQIPAGRRSALTGLTGNASRTETWSTTLPAAVGVQVRAVLQTSTGYPLEIYLTRLRDLPVAAPAAVQ
jgi:hypothetical protein